MCTLGCQALFALTIIPATSPLKWAFNEGSPASSAYWTRRASGSLIPLTGVHFLPPAI